MSEQIISNSAGETVLRKKIEISELLPQSHQFADILMGRVYTFDEANEEFKPHHAVNRHEGRYLLIFADKSSLEFFSGSNEMRAHDSFALDKVLAMDSRKWGVN